MRVSISLFLLSLLPLLLKSRLGTTFFFEERKLHSFGVCVYVYTVGIK